MTKEQIDPNTIFGKDYESFIETDPFNNNLVEGFISRKATEFYGALIITKVNNKSVKPQLIMGSPKMHYPFVSRADGTRRYTFPSVKNIEIYEKLDGTNIVAYFYYDDRNKRYLTFKTRLRPFAGSGNFGDFYNMWLEVATESFNNIQTTMQEHNCNLSFELYGSRNKHLVLYEIPLDFRLLFGVTNEGIIIPPSNINTKLVHADKYGVIDRDYVFNYERLQKELDAKLEQTEDGYYIGEEGTVWYLNYHDGRCLQIKNKPDTIEAIHMSQSEGLSKNVIKATCWNAFENTDNPTPEFISELLLEEFPQHIIDKNTALIKGCLDFVLEEARFKFDVLEAYNKTGLNILLNKADVMRQLSNQFPRNKMTKVYSIIVGRG